MNYDNDNDILEVMILIIMIMIMIKTIIKNKKGVMINDNNVQ